MQIATKKLINILLIFSFCFFAFQLVLTASVSAADSAPLWEMQEGLGSGNKDIGTKAFKQTSNKPADVRVLIAKAINIFLGILGITFMIIMVFAGYRLMTAGGNEDTMTEAKSSIVRAVIGLLIILMAWSISLFVTNCLSEVSGAGYATSDVWYCPEVITN